MRALLLSILYTAVFLILGSAFNYARAQSPQPQISAADWAAIEEKKRIFDAQDKKITACKEEVKEAEKTQKELLDSCSEISSDKNSDESKSSCIEIAAACAYGTKNEESSSVLGMFGSFFNAQFPKKDFNSTCLNANMTLTQWEKKEEKAQRELEKKKEKFEKLQEESQKVLENSNKAKQKMEEKTHDMDEEFQKLQKQAEEAGDKEQAEAAKAARDNESRLREIQSKNLAMTQAKAAKMQERAAMLATMTDALIQTDCLEKIQKFVREMNSSKRGSIVSGGASSAFNASKTGSTMAQSKWQACLSAAQGQRDATLTKYQGDIQSIDQEMSNLNQEYRAAQKTIQQNEQLAYKASARRESDKAVAQNLYQQRRQKLANDYMTALQEAQNKNQQLQGQLQTIQSEIAQLSNELAGLNAKKPEGDKTHSTAKKAAVNLGPKISDAADACGCSGDEKNGYSNTDTTLASFCKRLTSMSNMLKTKFNIDDYKSKLNEGADGE